MAYIESAINDAASSVTNSSLCCSEATTIKDDDSTIQVSNVVSVVCLLLLAPSRGQCFLEASVFENFGGKLDLRCCAWLRPHCYFLPHTCNFS